MLKGIPIGREDFKDIIENNYYYIDKTKFIEDLLLDGTHVKLFCRPRRFGKTLNMNTLKYFFDIKNGEENRKLFNGLYIENSPMIKEQGKYPVIFLTLKELKGSNLETIYLQIRTLISDLFNEFKYIRESLDERDLEIFDNIWKRKDEDYSNSLKFLIRCLSEYYNQKVILLIDEYDAPFITTYEFGYYEEILQFFKVFYGGALKSNTNLQMGVLTGIIRVAQAGIFSDLNNFISYTILDSDYSQSFGMVEQEVEEILNYYQVGYEMPEVKRWYDGYTFGKSEIYNPWSILNFVKNKELKSYWINTSSNFMIKELLQHTGAEGLETLEKIFNQENVAVRITDNVRFGNNLSASEVWELMVYSGYLTIKGKQEDGRYLVRIPNMEITNFFKDEFLSIIFGEYRVVDELRDALYDKNLRQLDKSIEKLIIYVMSSYDTSRKYENSYHMLLAGFFYALDGYYTIKSNMETGYGRADIILFPEDKSKAGYILELKRAKSNPEKEAKEALEQIEDKKYHIELERYGVKEIIKIAYIFDGKEVVSSN